jgi:hypothetical protein
MSTVYLSIDKYVFSIEDLQARILATTQIIAGMEQALLERATGQTEVGGEVGIKAGVIQYRIDDGQVKIETIFQDITAMSKSIEALRQLRKGWLADLNNEVTGRVFRLTSNNNFR